MAEFSPEVNEELVALSRAIESRRTRIEEEHGITDEHEVARHALREELVGSVPSSAATTTTPPVHYLDSLSPAQAEKLEGYLSRITKDGVRKTIEAVRHEEPFMQDAFHDALVDRLFTELTRHGYL